MKYWNNAYEVDATPVEPAVRHRWLGIFLRLSLLVAITFLVTVTGPFGTYAAGSLGERFIYWAVANGVSLGIAIGAKQVANVAYGRQRWSVREAGVILVTTLVFTPFLSLWTNFWFPSIFADAPGLLRLGFYVFAICVVISVLRYGVPRIVRARLVAEAAGLAAHETPPQPRLVRRLPQDTEHEILRLSVDGHKVQVFTTQGVFELRMRFADAVDEMDGLEGFSTHRSHWVARSAIAGIDRRNGKVELVLINGDRVPVSRKYHNEIEAAGIG